MVKLKVWWCPQVPMQPFEVFVATREEGKALCDILARYDLFQLKHNIKPDFCNAGGVSYLDHDGEWYDVPDDDDEWEDILASLEPQLDAA